MQRRWIWIGLGLTGLGLTRTLQLQRLHPASEDAVAVASLYVVLGITAVLGGGMLLAQVAPRVGPLLTRVAARR